MSNSSPVTNLDQYDGPFVDYEAFVTEDDTPVDNIFSSKQHRLLVEILYTSWKPGRRFFADTNVGLYYHPEVRDPVVPDMFLSMDVEPSSEWFDKRHRCYFVWVIGKPPDLVLEVVSNRKGKERTEKMEIYAQAGVPYYVVFDPDKHLSDVVLEAFRLTESGYITMAHPRFEEFGLSLTLWDGVYEDSPLTWLRWQDLNGNLLPNGSEQGQLADQQRATAEEQRRIAESERARAARLAEKLRAAGIDPDEL